MAPIRETFAQFGTFNGDSSTIEGALILYERDIQGREARSWTEIEDVALRDQLRSIYYLHVFDDVTFLFTRHDFVRTGPRTWSLITLSFGSQWNQVAVVTTPSFTTQN
jgi:hypothetical protein